MLSSQDKETITGCIFMIGLLSLWYILAWYQEKSGQGGGRR